MSIKCTSDSNEMRRATCDWCKRRRLCMIFTENDPLGVTRICNPCISGC